MALGGKYPILMVGLTDVLSTSETDMLRKLSAMSYAIGDEAAEAANNATVEALKTKAAAYSTSSISQLARLPIVLDGDIIPASMQSYSTVMIKQLSVFEGANVTKQAANTVSIDIKTSSSAGSSIFIDLLFSIADIIFSKSDIAPSVSFFGGSIAIPNGYLTRLSRKSNSNSSDEVITLEVAKDLSFLFEETETSIISTDKTPSITDTSNTWQIGG